MRESDLHRAIDRLIAIGLPPDQKPALMAELRGLLNLYEIVARESINARTERREALARQVRALAVKIEHDPNVQYWSLADHDVVVMCPLSNRPLIHQWLRDLSELIERVEDDPNYRFSYKVDHLRTTRMDRHEFIQREVLIILDQLPLTKASPNAEAAAIIDALLGQRPGTTKRQTLAQVRRTLRRNTTSDGYD